MIPISVKFDHAKITLMNREELKEFLIQSVYDKERFRVLLLDEKKYYYSLFDKEMQDIISKAEVVICASKVVAWACRVFTDKEVPVIMPVTILLDVMRVADEMNYTLFLYGGSKDVNVETLKRIKKSFGNARIVGNYRSGLPERELKDVLTAIRKSSPVLFFVNLGGGRKQEKWITANAENYPGSIVIGVDDSFKIISGRKRMPPIWMQKKGWTGFFRFLTEPYNFLRVFRVIAIFFSTVYKKLFKKAK